MADTTDWTPELIYQLRDLWASGLSTVEIGRRMGMTKSAVVGKAHRLNLPGRVSPIKRQGDSGVRKPPVSGPSRAERAAAAAAAMQAARDGNAAPVVPPAPRSAEAPLGKGAIPPTPAPAAPAAPPERLARPDPDSRFACTWPIGEPGSKTFAYCGEHIGKHRSYCPEHRELSTLSPSQLVRKPAPLPVIEAYAAEHRIVPKLASGLTGLIIAVNNHRRQANQIPYTLRASASPAPDPQL